MPKFAAKTQHAVRTYYVIPCCLLLFNLCVEVVSYKAKLIALPASQQAQVWASLEKQDAEQKAKTPGGN